MGYYTLYSLTMYGREDKVAAARQALLEESRGADGSYDPYVQELVTTGWVCAKCYELENQLSAVAERHPDVLIVLEGDGEDSGDLWEARWRGTEHEMQEARIPPFTNKNLFTETEKENNN